MKTLQLKIVGRNIGYNRGDGEPDAEKRLQGLQDAVTEVIEKLDWTNGDLADNAKGMLMDAVAASRLDEESSQGRSDVEWRLLIDAEDDDLSVNLRTACQASLASGNHIVLDRGNAEVFPDVVCPIEITVL